MVLLVLGFLYLKRMMYACENNGEVEHTSIHLSLFKENDVCLCAQPLHYSLYLKMEYTDPTTTGSTIPSSSSSLAPSLPTAVQRTCAACKILRRRCTDRCVLAPYFPPTEPFNFIIAHRVFGASNIIKSVQVIPPHYMPYVELSFYV